MKPKENQTKEEKSGQTEQMEQQPICYGCESRKIFLLSIEKSGSSTILNLLCANCGLLSTLKLNGEVVHLKPQPIQKKEARNYLG